MEPKKHKKYTWRCQQQTEHNKDYKAKIDKASFQDYFSKYSA
jgi:hypothetical protein